KPSAQAEIDIKTAVEELRASRPAEEPIEAIEYKRLENGEKAPENETVSLERAADDLTAYHSQQSVERAKSISEDFAKAIDSMRADALKANPKANDELGLSKQEIAAAKAAKTEAAQDETVPETLEARQEPSEPDAYDSIEGLEPELKEVLRKSPQARQFFESYAAEGEQVKEAYTAGLNNAHQFGQAAILALAPELSQVPLERWGEGISILAQSDPARGQQLATMFSNVAAIAQRQQLITHHEQQLAQQNFEALRQDYSKKSDEVLGPMTVAEKTAMAEELVSYVSQYGVTREQLVHEAKTNLALNHPAFQRMAADAIKYQRLMNAPKAHPTRQIPPVTRPGTAGQRSGADISRIQSLQDQLKTATGNRALKLGAQLTAEMRRAANR
ncbi:MAG TPA: hypothetical protein VNS88_01885, partial [Nitrospiraceae bacterium]|nr:hypothetical protein [Nitrospiraceae bacterium]